MPRAYRTSPWLKRVLIPFWVVRILLMVIVVAGFGIALGRLAEYKHTSASDSDIYDGRNGASYDDLDDLSRSETRKATIIIAVFFVLLASCLLLDVLSIIFLAMHRLKPRTFLIFNVLQTTLWLVILILDIVVATRSSAFGGLFTIVEFLIFLGLLIYAAVVYHRERKQGRGIYEPALNPEQSEPLSFPPPPQLYQEAYAPCKGTGYRGNGPQPQQAMPMHDYHASAAARQPSPQPPNSPFSSEGPYVLPGPHPSVSLAQPQPLPGGHPTTGAPPYVLPPSPYKGGRE